MYHSTIGLRVIKKKKKKEKKKKQKNKNKKKNEGIEGRG